MKKSKPKSIVRRKVVKEQAYGILNQFGEFWTPAAFPTENLARKYYKEFWGQNQNPPKFDDTHTVVPVTITYSLPAKDR